VLTSGPTQQYQVSQLHFLATQYLKIRTLPQWHLGQNRYSSDTYQASRFELLAVFVLTSLLTTAFNTDTVTYRGLIRLDGGLTHATHIGCFKGGAS
jgi:hypothetical protein